MTARPRKRTLRIPTAAAVQEPRQRGHLGRRRWPATSRRRPRRAAPTSSPRPSATQLLVEDGARRAACAPATRAAARTASRSATSSPAPTSRRQATVLAEGCWGHLTGAAIREFDLGEDREPQVWELGVKEVWKVPKPLDRLIHTIGPWPLKLSSKYGQIGGTWIYPMKDEKTGDDLVSIGFVDRPRVRRRDDLGPRPAAAVQDCTRSSGRSSRAASASAWGAKALPGGGYWSMPKLTMPGALLVGDAGGMVDTVALKGVHHCIKSGMLAAEAIYAALKRGATSLRGLRGRRSRSRRSARSSTRSATRASRSRRASSRAARSST